MQYRHQIAVGSLCAAAAAKDNYRRLGAASETTGHRVKKLYILPNATSTAHASNYATITITNATRSKTLATWSTVTGGAANTGTLTAGTPVEPTLGDDVWFAAGDLLKVAVTHAASGVAIDCTVELDIIEST